MEHLCRIDYSKTGMRFVEFWQEPRTPPARRQWMSIDLGTEIFKAPDQVAEWTVSDFDILVPRQ